jgi:four helix bundle protein
MDNKVKYQSYEEVPVWKDTHKLTLSIYKITEKFPAKENFGLTSQIRRSASSIPANIAEGFHRNSTKELLQFLYNARGSYGETLYHLRLAFDLNYVDKKNYTELRNGYIDIGKQLNGWIKSLRSRL